MAGRFLSVFTAIFVFSFSWQVYAVEFRGAEYDVYLGDVNGDGIDDIYLKVPDTFVLIHGDISVPLLIDSDTPSYLINSVDVSSPYYDDPVVDESIDVTTLTQIPEDELESVDVNGDGVLDLRITSPLLLFSLVIDGFSDTFLSTLPAPPVDPNYYTGIPLPAVFVQPAHDPSVGALPGEHKVEQNGAAGYTIPINISGGRAGVQPSLSIGYNSNAGNSALGLGWTLDGLSAIQRCPNNTLRGEEPNPVDYTSSDKFCLDGQRLVITDGIYGDEASVYKKESDDGTKVIAYGLSGTGPMYFKVWSPNGFIHEYGNTTDSRVFGAGAEVATWAQNRIEDRYTNYLTVSYEQPAGSGNYRPVRMDYTGNTNASQPTTNSVVFHYTEDRPDPTLHYLGGEPSALTWLMNRIDVYSQNTELRRYILSYDNLSYGEKSSRLTSVQLCATTVCMQPTEINWSEENFGIDPVERWAASTVWGITFKSEDGSREQYMDLTGDGLADRIWSPDGSNDAYYVAVNTGSGFEGPVRWLDATYVVGGKTINSESLGERETYIDVDGDGLQDRVWEPDGDDDYYWAKNTGSGFNHPELFFTKYMVSEGGVSIRVKSENGRQSYVDLNNDGLSDRIWDPDGADGFYVMLNNGGSFGAPELWLNRTITTSSGENVYSYSWKGEHEFYQDMNGDGFTDRIWIPKESGHLYVALNNGSEFYHVSRWLSSYASPVGLKSWNGAIEQLTDVNGDGLPDWVWNPDGSNEHYYVALNTGKEFGTPTIWLENGSGGINAVSYQGKFEQYVDLNGDGLVDRFWQPHDSNQNYYVAFNTGESFDTPMEWLSSNEPATTGGSVNTESWNGTAEQFVDLNGDGISDRIWDPQGADNGYYVAITKPNYGRVESIVVGNAGSQAGHTTSFYYKPSIDTSVYNFSEVSGTYPIINDVSSKALVYRVTTSNGVGGVLSSEYSYANGRVHLDGHGSLGFESMTTTNADNGIATTTYFNFDVDVKTQGTVNKVVTHYNGVDLSVTENTWVNVSTGSGDSASNRVELQVTNIVKRDLGGQFLSDERNTYAYNAYGAPTVTESLLLDENEITVRTKITTNEYTAFNSYDHLLPSVEQTTVDVTVAGKPTISTISAFEYQAGTGKKTKEKIINPVLGTVLSETEYHDIDAFGNHQKTTVRGVDFAERTSGVIFDPTGRYAISTSNAYQHSNTVEYYPNDSIDAGRVDVSTDINGMRTKFEYDVFGRVTRTIKAHGTNNPISSRTSLQWCDDITDGLTCATVNEPEDSVYIYRITSSADGGSGKHVFVDKLGREVKSSTQNIDGRFVNVVNHYDAFGRNYRACDPFFAGTLEDDIIFTDVKHDALGRVIESVEANGVISTVEYNGLERISTNNVGPDSQKKTEYRNVMNKVVKVIDNDLNETNYDFDSLGNLIEVEDSELNKTTIVYDELNRKIEMDDLDIGLWKYTYNGLGELVTQTNAKEETSCISYDLLGRMTQRIDNYTGTVSRDLGGLDQAKDSCSGAEGVAYSFWDFDSAPNKGLGKLYRSGLSDGSYLITNHYDSSFGRVIRTEERIDGISYVTENEYDELHRVLTATYPGVNHRVGVKSIYNNLGFQVQLENVDDSTEVFYSLIETDAQGNVLEEILGNGVKTVRTYDQVTNRITLLKSWLPIDAISPSIQELDFTFDVVGNLTARNDYIQNIGETFEYDSLNRLTDMYADFGNGESQETNVAYDALGNITEKSGVGSYSYGGTCNGRVAGPHAVTQITSPKNANYCYDDNGNMVEGDGRTIAYSAFDKPIHIQKGSYTTQISYNPDRARYKRVDTDNGKTTTYHYAGGIYENVTHANGDIEERSFIGDFAIYTHTQKADNSASGKTQYLHKDHIGSITVITDGIGRVVEEFSFDPWGKRRAPNLNKLTDHLGGWPSLTADERANLTITAQLLRSKVTNKGFTGHEQMDGVGLIHMNGRVYDAEIGRFISADPHVQDVTNMQSLNRYSYVLNNPLSYTDPSGYFLKNIFKKFVKHIKRMHESAKSALRAIGRVLNAVPGLSTVVGLVISFYCPPCGAAYFQYLTLLNAAISLANGVPPGTVLTNSAVGFVTGGVGAGIGNIVGNQLVGSMIASGIAAKASGGKFIDGVKSAAISAATSAAANFAGNKLVEGLSSMGEGKAEAAAPVDSSGANNDSGDSSPVIEGHLGEVIEGQGRMEGEWTPVAKGLKNDGYINEDEITIVGHGTKHTLERRGFQTTAEEYAQALSGKVVKGETTIRIFSCNVGRKGGFAQRISAELGVTVVAPNNFFNYRVTGRVGREHIKFNIGKADDMNTPDGRFVTYKNGVEVK